MAHTTMSRNCVLGSRFAATVFCVALAACSTTKSSQSSEVWLEASPILQQKIDMEAERLPWTHGIERVELIYWFANVGEPAYATLLEMVSDSRADVAGAALAALGATHDERLVQPLHRIPWPAGAEFRDVRLERARTLLRLGDWSVMPTLIEGLDDERLMTRALCVQALTDATHEKLGYDPRAEENERAEAIQRWEMWWEDRSQDTLLTR